MVVSTPEKDRALEELHRIQDRLDRLNDTLDRIADALEDIAIEAKRPHETAMEQQRRREAAAGRAGKSFITVSGGEVVEDQNTGSDDLTDDQFREIVSRKKESANFKGV